MGAPRGRGHRTVPGTPVPDAPETTVPIAHRIIGSDAEGFITKGDNPQANPDYWRIALQAIDGQAVWWFPKVWLLRAAAILIGLAFLLALWPVHEHDQDDQPKPELEHATPGDPVGDPST